jgi:DNA-binding MarR family transcriptional regulator
MEQTVPTRWQDLTRGERDTLVTLSSIGPSTAREINRALGRDDRNSSMVSRALTSLRESGFVEQTPADDRRGPSKYNHLTDDGTDLLGAVCEAHTRAVENKTAADVVDA